MDRDIRVFRVTLKINFDIDATSEEVAREMANDQAIEWLRSLDTIENSEIEVIEKGK